MTETAWKITNPESSDRISRDCLLLMLVLLLPGCTTSRIDVVVGNQPGGFKKALQVINEKGADIINVSMTDDQSGQRIYYCRLAACKTAGIKKALEKQGYEVLAAID